jgi:tRNA threonylcarbamoyladenosine biosynthesis protein TsaB
MLSNLHGAIDGRSPTWKRQLPMANSDELSLPIIFALDTSSKRASMAVARGGRLIVSHQGDADEKRSESVWAETDALLGEAGLTINDVDLFSVCTGPGGFTGLRVGIAAIKGLAVATEKRVIGVTSLEAVALLAAPAQQVFATVYAYKGEVYSQLFRFDDEGLPVAQEPPVVSISIKAIERVAHLEGVVFAGEWAVANAEFIKATGRSVNMKNRSPAEAIAEIAFKKYGRSGGEAPEHVRACYVKVSEAEIKLSEGVLGSKIKRVVKQD